VIFETGYGPSSLPHIGTFCEVARTSMVRRALEALKPCLDARVGIYHGTDARSAHSSCERSRILTAASTGGGFGRRR
jgi:tRNA synthetases class I (K)